MTSKTAVAVVGDMPGCTRLVLLGAHLNSKRQDALRPNGLFLYIAAKNAWSVVSS